MADEKKPKDAKEAGDGAVKAGGWEDERPKPKWRNFPAANAGASSEPLRVAFNREAYAEISSHAKDSLDKEICGVLVGDLCEDDHGEFIEVTAVIRGTAAKKGATHVTFTQETWNQIHEEKEKSHRKRQILGWYHSHPGFGVDFSEMDLFIQKNFFGGPTQIAFVIDPLGGQEAILANRGGSTVPVRKFWVDGRERKAVAPGGGDGDADKSSGGGGGSST